MAVTIPRAAVDFLTEEINGISADAQARVLKVLQGINWTPENVAQCRDLVIQALSAVMPTYTTMAAQASADFYDAARELVVGEKMGAQAISDFDMRKTEGAVRAFVRFVLRDEVQTFNDQVLQRIDYEMKRSANMSVVENGRRDPKKVRYARVPTGAETCDFCLMLASRGFVYQSEGTAGAGHTHYACVLPETNLGAVGVRAGLRRKYEGVVCDISTRGGRHLSVTPNHPVLTVRGWVDAGHLEDGDALVCRSIGDGDDLRVPEVDETPPRADEVFEALGLLLSPRPHAVKVSAEHFDGEPVPDGYVEVVDVDGLLERHVIAEGDELLGDDSLALARSVDGGIQLNGPGMLELGLNGEMGATGCIMGRFGLSCPLLWSHLGRPDKSGLGPSSKLTAGFREPPCNCWSADGVDVGKLKHACSTLIALNDSGRCSEPVSARLDAAALERSVDDVLAGYSDLFGYVSGCHSGGVELDYVSVVRHTWFNGHVYNLSTVGGWYFANGIIVHNCDCRVVPGWDGMEVEGYDPRSIYDRWQDAIDAKARERAERNGTTVSEERSAIMAAYGRAAKNAKRAGRKSA